MTRSSSILCCAILSLITLSITLGCFSTGREVGDGCLSSCADDLVCAQDSAGEGICTSRCDTPSSLCADGSLCIPLDTGGGVCQIEELSGTSDVGESCSSNKDCMAGMTCAGLGVDTACWQVCDPGSTPSTCAADEVCTPYGSASGHVCQKTLKATCSEEEPCPASYQCGLEEDYAASFEEILAFGGTCNVIDCATDADCPGSAVCRAGVSVYDEQTTTWQTNTEVTRSYCYVPCSAQRKCSFLDGTFLTSCITRSTCEGVTEGKQDCLDFVGNEDGLCLNGF